MQTSGKRVLIPNVHLCMGKGMSSDTHRLGMLSSILIDMPNLHKLTKQP